MTNNNTTPAVSEKNSAWQTVNTVYVVFLVVVGLAWIMQWHTFGFAVGVVAIAVSYFIYQRKRWAYFAAAVLYFGLFRIAMDDGYDFHQGFQSIAKLIYITVVVLAIILHEKIAIKNKKTESNDSEMPD